jgi:hypothetical protein
MGKIKSKEKTKVIPGRWYYYDGYFGRIYVFVLNIEDKKVFYLLPKADKISILDSSVTGWDVEYIKYDSKKYYRVMNRDLIKKILI